MYTYNRCRKVILGLKDAHLKEDYDKKKPGVNPTPIDLVTARSAPSGKHPKRVPLRIFL